MNLAIPSALEWMTTITRRAMLIGSAGVLAGEANTEERMTHIALLGDSVIDNKAYVGAGRDVAGQLRKLSPKEWQITRLALDGAVSSGVLRQLENLPTAATHVVISAGGNDALAESHVLDAAAQSVG